MNEKVGRRGLQAVADQNRAITAKCKAETVERLRPNLRLNHGAIDFTDENREILVAYPITLPPLVPTLTGSQ